ncbi:MAG: hypothetical protein JWP63_4591 [Candidatus Solibacter sp.]|nr:hypothetical protein [Candidatus Solibacter sp.]
MRPRRFPYLKSILAFLVLLAVLYLARGVWLSGVGTLLVHDDGPAKADLAVLLGGDSWGFRMESAALLVKQGYVPRVLVSGPAGMYGLNEADAAIHWAVERGYPAEWFVALPHQALSTRTESKVLLDYMRQHGIHSFLLVTSNYHTARARRVFLKTEREMGGGPEFRMVASGDKYYVPGGWWKTREGLKVAFMEWAKTVATALGI